LLETFQLTQVTIYCKIFIVLLMSFYLARYRWLSELFVQRESCDLMNNASYDSWYALDTARFRSAVLAESFVKMNIDSETVEFIKQSQRKSDSTILQLFHGFAISLLRLFFEKTCINGLLRRGSMFLFSAEQLYSFLDIMPKNGSGCLDLGAGDGQITLKLKKFFPNVAATEASPIMRLRLRQHGIKVVGIDEWRDERFCFEIISCLNLLDRHAEPLTLLRHIHTKAVACNAYVLIAVVFPWYQFVEYTDHGKSNAPREWIDLNGNTFEEQLECFVKKVLQPSGFNVVRFTRLPYLSEGDMMKSFYVLDCALLLLTADK
ncbi:Methyltransferase-like protein 9, partial [Trichinella patagoniensis]